MKTYHDLYNMLRFLLSMALHPENTLWGFVPLPEKGTWVRNMASNVVDTVRDRLMFHLPWPVTVYG